MKLLAKEIRLAFHPIMVVFLIFNFMVTIPNYPYYVVTFYASMSVYFVGAFARENKDAFYTMLLPVRKRDVVRGRMLFIGVYQLLSTAVLILFCELNPARFDMPNAVGMDGNIVLAGVSLALLGVVNLVFFPRYYRNTNKVGLSFFFAAVVLGVLAVFAEIAVHMIPFAAEVLDTPDPYYLGQKMPVFFLGLAIYLLLTFAAYQISWRVFEKTDVGS